ncbi:MAG: VWA-like domain-containing protein [Burkholderiaceae bacterium]|nr:VWA-like domain-containing protein [Burkholderiaceae bacterium]
MTDVETRLAAARARLLLDKPFLGALALRLPLVPARWCRTTASDARTLYYNPQWIAGLTGAQLQFALAHEALHCALGHFARRGHRSKRRWDLACDLAINPILLEEGLQPPPEATVLTVFRGMSAEEIYPCLRDEDEQRETLDQHLWDGEDGGAGGSGQASGRGGGDGARTEARGGSGTRQAALPPPLAAAERDRLAQQWRQHLAAAAQRARQAGRLSGQLARLVEAALAARLNWRALLAQYLAQSARDDFCWQRPSRREGEAILPALRSRAGDIHVALDVSGSVGEAELAEFLAELNAIKGALPARVTLYACDSALAPDAPWVFETWETLRLPRRFAGGGGTSFSPVFDWIDRHGLHPDALVYFTDAQGEFPRSAPAYPVLWVVKGGAPVPFGRRVALS